MTFFTSIWQTLLDIFEARHEPEKMRPLAEWYWRILLTIALFALAAVMVYGVWEFYGVMRKLAAGANRKHSETPVLLNRKELTELLAAYSARTNAFDAAKAARASIADPSR